MVRSLIDTAPTRLEASHEHETDLTLDTRRPAVEDRVMQRLPTPALSGDYVLRAEIELDKSLLRIDGDVLEHFRALTLSSQGRLLLRGVTAGVGNPDEDGNSELRIIDADGSALILLPVPADRVAEAESFAASVRYAASGTSAGWAA
jgi:hypothetical protein